MDAVAAIATGHAAPPYRFPVLADSAAPDLSTDTLSTPQLVAGDPHDLAGGGPELPENYDRPMLSSHLRVAIYPGRSRCTPRAISAPGRCTAAATQPSRPGPHAGATCS